MKDGIYRAGGTPVEFGVIGGCDGMGQGHDGMHYILPSREIIANSVESIAQINLFDAIVLLGSPDKIVPGLLMAAARLDIPCILLPGGPMEGGIVFDGRQSDQTSSAEAYGMLSANKITEEEYKVLEECSCPTCGSCSYLGTANTMCSLSEALGMTLPDGGIVPASSAARLAIAEETGVKIVELLEKGITARKIITNESVRNAIKVCLAMSGSTNAVMHLTAIAHEAELDIDVLEEFGTLSKTTPQVAKINPASKYNMVDFYRAGGVVRLMSEMSSILDTDQMTVSGGTVAENIASHRYLYPVDRRVIRTLDEPFGYTGGVAVLRGNLAPDTGITKPGAFDESLHHFVGEAICFDSEEEAEEAIIAGKVRDGHVVVIRYEGPRGRPRHAGDVQGHEVSLWPRSGPDHRPHHRRPVLRHQQRLLCGPHLSGGGRGRSHRHREGRRQDRDRCGQRRSEPAGERRGDRRAPEGVEASGAQGESGATWACTASWPPRRQGRHHGL